MNRSTISIEDFMEELDEAKPRMREMMPTDVEKLSSVELSGLMYWVEKLKPFSSLNAKERDIFFKVRARSK